MLDLVRAARRERAGGRRLQHVARCALDRPQLAPCAARRGAGRSASRPSVYGCRGCAKICSAEPVSMNMPPYITCTRSHMPATTPRSCVIRISAVSRLGDERAQQVEDLRLDRHVERRRRLVGDQELRLARERHRDHRALAHAARELVRVVLEPRLRRSGSRPGRAARPTRSSRLRLAEAEVRLERLADLAPDRQHRDSGSSSGPGRSSRSRGRGSGAARESGAPIRSRPSNTRAARSSPGRCARGCRAARAT